MPNKTEHGSGQRLSSPDYEKLARFLIEPFLEDAQSLSVNSEVNSNNKKIWLRIAFDKSDRGKVFGRGGRNIQAIRTTIQTAAKAHDQSVFLDIYSDESSESDNGDRRRSSSNNRRRKSPSKPAPKIAKN